MTGPLTGGALRDEIAGLMGGDEGVVCELEDRVARARENPEDFFELVMRSEKDQRDIRVAAHQRVGLRFMYEHKRSVNIWPINEAKSFSALGLTLFFTGRDPNTRGAVVSATQMQSEKIVRTVGAYIDHNPLMRLVWNLKRGPKWTDTLLIVERPSGIKDPTLAAYGIDSRGILGSRLDWVVCDDLLNEANTRTKEQRESTKSFFSSSVMSRVEEHDQARIVLMNSAWHPDDLLHDMDRLGWATLRMQVDGNLYIKDDIADVEKGVVWDHPMLVAHPGGDVSLGERCRLKAPGHDAKSMLWPEMYPDPEAAMADLRRKQPIAIEFNRQYMSVCRDDGSAMCKADWVEQCKRLAREKGIYGLTHKRTGGQTYTGVDLAFSPSEQSDDCAMVTIEVLPTGHRLILDAQVGKWDGPTLVKMIVDIHRRYDSIVRVENVAGQDLLLHFLRSMAVGVPVRPHVTGRNKAHPEHGVHSIFTEFANGAWLLPNDQRGTCPPGVQRLVDDCLNYVPSKHTGDALMACWFAREQAREFGALSGAEAVKDGGGSIAMSVLSR